MSEYTESNSLIMSMKTSRVKAMGLVNGLFEELRTKLNELKNDDLITDETVLPFALGMITEVGKAFVESREQTQARESANIAFARLTRTYFSDVMPWDDLVNYSRYEL
jgi:hypothetical protein